MADLLQRVLLLKDSAIFGEVPSDELRVVATAMEEESYLRGDLLFEKHDYGDRMYIVTRGRVGIALNEPGEPREIIAEIGAGECVGEMAVIDGHARSATALVLEDSDFLVIDKLRLTGLLTRYPQVALGMLRGLSRRLRDANAQR
ncbi:MAG TPA: cyclic nucleotide-binding domain-containing protein [Gammaproteobacteria bacterium]